MTSKIRAPLILLLCMLITVCIGFAAAFPGAGAAESSFPSGTDEVIPYYLQGSELVYITATGVRYHRTDHCSNTQTAFLLSLEEACRLGYTPCGRCHPAAYVEPKEDFSLPEGSTVVYITVGDECYHATPDCGGCQTAVPVTLEEALYLNRRPCKQCEPPK